MKALVLFVASSVTTFYAGLHASGNYWIWRWLRGLEQLPRVPEHALARMPDVWLPALSYSAGFMAILFCHEMGHYLTARRYGVETSPPYFIPFLPPLGSLGAVIGMPVQPMSSRALMRIAAFGPFAGFLVTLPVVVVGLGLSDVRPIPPDFAGMRLGTPLAFAWIQNAMFGPIPAGHDVFLHPLALAGWAGCLITGLNLLPFGQLDGGHVAYGLLGETFNRYVRRAAAIATLVLLLVNPGFVVFLLLLWFLIRVEHPPVSTDGVARGPDRWIGLAAVLLFIVSFTPRPIHLDWASLLGSG